MNSIRQVPTRVKSRRTEANLGAEREHFDKQQSFSVLLIHAGLKLLTVAPLSPLYVDL
ncbi:Huntingtin-interacting protein 1-related protein, partial [Dissostichus eleginoides]